MNHQQVITYWFVACFGMLSLSAEAQANLKIGYNISFLSNPGFDQVISAYGASQPYYDAFDPLRWFNGMETGLRIKSNVHALELSYQGGYQRLRAKGNLNGGSERFIDRMTLGIHAVSLGYQATDGVFGMGADLQYQWYLTKVELAQANSVFKNVQNNVSMKIYGMFTFTESLGIDMSVQPYWVMPFQTYNTNPLQNYLQVDGSFPEDKWTRFGLTLLFYNGAK